MLTADTRLDIDVPAVKLQGQVTLGGVPQQSAWLSFVPGAGSRAAVSSTETGSSYSTTLLSGQYAVWSHSQLLPKLCEANDPLPCVDAPLAGCP
jgi:hypothetical protein